MNGMDALFCTMCGRPTSLDHSRSYIITVVQTSRGRHSVRRDIRICDHCAAGRRHMADIVIARDGGPRVLMDARPQERTPRS